MSLDQLKELLESKESEHLEFKEAKSSYEFEDLVKYCVALANEKGGNFVLWVSDKLPRKIVGSHAFPNVDQTKASVSERLHLRVDAQVIQHPDGRGSLKGVRNHFLIDRIVHVVWEISDDFEAARGYFIAEAPVFLHPLFLSSKGTLQKLGQYS